MAVRQYIGARYVPKFYENSANSAEWRSGVAYEPLTIVTYNGNSYTSKKPVPASIGNPSANPSYWVSTGIYNQQIDEYREEVADLRTRVNTDIEGRKFILIGDSWAAGLTYNSATASRGPSFYDVMISSLGLMQGDTYYKNTADGCGFVDNDPHTFLELLQAVNVADAGKITDIYVTGGLNDRPYTEAQIETAISAFMTYAKTTYPNAKVSIGCVGIGSSSYANMSKVNHAYRKCVKYGAAYMDGIESYVFGRTIRYDGMHGTTEGYAIIGEGIINYTLTGSCGTYAEGGSFSVTAASGVNITNMDTILYSIRNGNVFMASNKHWVRFIFDSAPANLGSVKVATLSDYSPIKDTPIRSNITVRGGESGNLYPASLSIYGNEIFLSIIFPSALTDKTYICNQLELNIPVELSAG